MINNPRNYFPPPPRRNSLSSSSNFFWVDDFNGMIFGLHKTSVGVDFSEKRIPDFGSTHFSLSCENMLLMWVRDEANRRKFERTNKAFSFFTLSSDLFSPCYYIKIIWFDLCLCVWCVFLCYLLHCCACPIFEFRWKLGENEKNVETVLCSRYCAHCSYLWRSLKHI